MKDLLWISRKHIWVIHRCGPCDVSDGSFTRTVVGYTINLLREKSKKVYPPKSKLPGFGLSFCDCCRGDEGVKLLKGFKEILRWRFTSSGILFESSYSNETRFRHVLQLQGTHRVRTHAVLLLLLTLTLTLTFDLSTQNHVTCRISQGHSLYQVWTLWVTRFWVMLRTNK